MPPILRGGAAPSAKPEGFEFLVKTFTRDPEGLSGAGLVVVVFAQRLKDEVALDLFHHVLELSLGRRESREESYGVRLLLLPGAKDVFLGQLPSGWQYGVEVRNRNLLCEPYLAMLRRHGVAHVMNNWTQMPSVAEQMQMPGVGLSFVALSGTRSQAATISPGSRVRSMPRTASMAPKCFLTSWSSTALS
mgnify:CR=1 FL=1